MANQKESLEPAVVQVDFAASEGELDRIWTSIGFDEINWSYTPQGKELLAMLNREVAEQPYYVRNHNTFTSGNGLSYPAGGSTNVYREDAEGNPVYNWEILDQVYDAYVANNFHPLIELGFLPFDLVPTDTKVYTGFGNKGTVNLDLGKEDYESGKWKLPPKDYTRWQNLVEAFVAHLVERYGRDEVAQWYFELWNEPDIAHYWLGTVDEYCKLYDYSVAGATRAFPQVKIGGPGSTDKGTAFLRHVLNHCTRGQNYLTGQTGTQIDFISFHTKGAYYSPRRTYGQPVETDSPSLSKMMQDIQACLGVIAEFPELRGKPVFVDECDPAVGTIYGVYDNPNFIVCNTEYYPTFVAAMIGQILQHNRTVPIPVTKITHWAFYFEGKRFFEGNRTLATNQNIVNPIFAGLKMLGRLGKQRVALQSSAAAQTLQAGYTGQTRFIDGLATTGTLKGEGGQCAVMLWHHCDDWTVRGTRTVDLKLVKLPFQAGQTVEVRHWRIDGEHSNAYSEWLKLGRPEGPDAEQLARLKASQQLTLLEEPQQLSLDSAGSLQLSFDLPVHGLSLIELSGTTQADAKED
jgi:xylan 1,4-beta-xylosidase